MVITGRTLVLPLTEEKEKTKNRDVFYYVVAFTFFF